MLHNKQHYVLTLEVGFISIKCHAIFLLTFLQIFFLNEIFFLGSDVLFVVIKFIEFCVCCHLHTLDKKEN